MTATEIDKLARSQHGLLTRAQALALLGPDRLKLWLARARLIPVHAGVYRLAGAPRTWEQSVLAAVLAAGSEAVASHRTAARLWGLLQDDAIEVTVPIGRRAVPAGAVVHRSRDLHRAAVHMRRGIPTTSPMRALVDLGAVATDAVVSDVLERGLSARRFTIAAVEWALNDVSKRGRIGCGALRRVLDRRALGAKPSDGLLEPRFARLAHAYGLPAYEFQFPVGPYTIDFAWPGARLLVEVDGWETHGTPAAMRSDLERQNYLVLAGWTVLRFTWADVVRRPKWVATRVREALAGCIPGSIQSPA